MPSRYHMIASYGMKIMERRIRARAWRSPAAQFLRESSSSSNRPLHTTSSLHSPAASLLQDNEDDEDLIMFVASHSQELAVRDTSASLLETNQGASSIWDTALLDKQQQQNDQTLKYLAFPEVMAGFDPENRPESLEALQDWLECEAHLDSTRRFQKILNSARDRQDYGSIGVVQRQILEWFQPLKDAFQKEQAIFMSGMKKKKSMNAYGHHLCALSPEKLAIMVSHESILHCLVQGKVKDCGVSLASIARHIGAVIETEINVQRAIEKRMRASQALEDDNPFLDALSDYVKEDESLAYSSPTGDVDDDDDDDDADSSGWMYTAHHRHLFVEEISRNRTNKRGKERIRYTNRRARAMIESTDEWTVTQHVQLGAALLEILVRVATVPGLHGQPENAFTYHKAWHNNKLVGWVLMQESLLKQIMEDSIMGRSALWTRHSPMIVPPRPWVSPSEGSYKWLKVEVMRTHGSKVQREALLNADLSTALDGLNVLGQVPWKINKTILKVAEECWRSGIPIGDIPSRVDLEVPPAPIKPETNSTLFLDKTSEAFKRQFDEYKTYKEALAKHNRLTQKNNDLRSLRCSVILKLDQAAKFKDFEKIYFPYNMDFRGRVYPMPPHLSNVGSDLCRGMLTFAQGKKLGKRGLYWLKVHLANLAGKDKITFDERADYTDQNMENIRASVEDPFGENKWWMNLEDPFQGLAACHEIVNAIDSGDPESYECSLPVHMDGSCNGLQHYAALGRDAVGGRAVNLCNEDRPQDVYSGVMHEVIRQVAAEAAIDLDIDESRDDLTKKEKAMIARNRSAKLVNGLIDRSVVKRTVMTSVYGVTFMGARNQIQEKIEEKLEEQGMDVDEMQNDIRQSCGYLAQVTMDVMGQLFSGARQTMNWLTACAKAISKQGQPVAFLSPIGVPVVQPYRRSKPHTIVTLLQTVVLVDESDDLPIHKQRQATAFPPNYVHSLDSSHMLLTALEMDRRGLCFSAVHDSFWTHPSDVDEMNEALRDCFVELYENPLLEKLKESWEMRYPSVKFPDLPKRGVLNLGDVRSARYFFQ